MEKELKIQLVSFGIGGGMILWAVIASLTTFISNSLPRTCTPSQEMTQILDLLNKDANE